MATTNNINLEILESIIVGKAEPQIYAFTTETVPNYLKVGDTYRPLEKRLNEWRKHFPNLEKKFQELAKVDETTFFRDYAVHYFLENELQKTRLQSDDLPAKAYYSNEFFKEATTQDIENAIEDIKENYTNNRAKYQYYKFDESRIPITYTYRRTENYSPRPNQQATINRFKEAIQKGRKNLLMYAVMRFGKSFTSMCCAVEMNAEMVLVVSAKADVKSEWKKTVESHIRFDGYGFLDSQSLLQSDTMLSERRAAGEKVVLFLTLQDLQGDAIKAKHKEVFENQIDLLLIDETHFGARAEEYGKVLRESNLSDKEIKKELELNDNSIDELDVMKVINAKVRLHLSGTPYRILMNSEFTDDDIIAFYQFSDIATDQTKWDEENLLKDDVKEWENPYYGFPQMIRFAFNPNESARKKMEQLKKNGVTSAFLALLKPKSIKRDQQTKLHKKFQYEKEIRDLLRVIDGSKSDENLFGFLDYPKLKEGSMCRHMVIVLPYRASCDALEALIKTNTFKNLSTYEIINISGVENTKAYKDTKSVQAKIKKCESENKKTITLTVNRMLTGSTVPQWDTMLYLKDTASPQEYDQAIFRLQNQYVKTYTAADGDTIKHNMKSQTLLVDFNPNRMFRMQEQKSKIYNVNIDTNGNTQLEERIKRELEISPIIVLNKDKMVKVEPSEILDAVREYSNERSVFDEATTLSIDYSLLDVREIKDEIDRQGKIGSRQGIEIKASKGDGDDMEIEDTPSNDDETEATKAASKTSKKEAEENYKGKFAMYYARILFFAFLTNAKVKSLEEVIAAVKNNADNRRIATNLSLDIGILALFQKHINPFILSELDYKIQNINALANDTSIAPIERAGNAMKKFSRLSDSEIVTPEVVTSRMIDALPSAAIDENTLLIDIAAKQGEFVYAVYKKFGKEVANNFYSIPTSKIAYEFTRKVYSLLELDMNLIEENYTSYDLIEKKDLVKNNTITFNNKKLAFDVIVGNPPYQQSDGGAQASAKPIYHHFVDVAKTLHPSYICMIMPARWYAGGRGLNKFRAQMLDDVHIAELHDFLKPKLLFSEIELKGGICYYFWDSKYDNQKSLTKVFTYIESLEPELHIRSLKIEDADILIRHNLAIEILKKIRAKSDFSSFENYISSLRPFGFRGYFTKDKRFRKTKKGLKNPVICYGKGRLIGFVERTEITKNTDWIDKYKIFTSRANNIGMEAKDDNLNTFLGAPNTICTESYMVVGVDLDLNKATASNISKYFKTKFARFQHSVGKASQDATSKTYKFVPLQDFTSNSDIDWNKSIAALDEQLYKKYNLTDEEIAFIERMIKPM